MEGYLRIPDEDDFILRSVGPGEYHQGVPLAGRHHVGHDHALSDFYRTSHAKTDSIGPRIPPQFPIALHTRRGGGFVHLSISWLPSPAELALPCSALPCSAETVSVLL